jgi:very-short-patch-repair endonuclease
MNNQLFNRKHLKAFRKELRNNATPAESHLWQVLRKKKLAGRKFRRQHSIGNYIVDFYCPSEKIVVELDGDVHENPVNNDYDRTRDNFLKNKGFKVLRFENEMVFKSPDLVLAAIKDAFRNSY